MVTATTTAEGPAAAAGTAPAADRSSTTASGSGSGSTSGANTPGTAPMQYAYMFEKDKGPTKQCDAILRAIAMHIITEIGDRNVCQLTPSKLAAFYKAVGGDYDPLFIDGDHQAISVAWQKTGCQHTLQPTENDFDPPSIPALTLRGFSRWTSVEILLGPEEHVPYIQYAVRNWNLRHPETGEPFPKDLPKSVFPTETDADVDRWHKMCGQLLRHEAEVSAKTQERTDPKFAYVNSRGGFKGVPKGAPKGTSGRARFAEPEYSGIPFSYVHPGKHGRHPGDRTPPTANERTRRDDFSDERDRRRSWSDYPSPPSNDHSHHSYPPKADTFPKRPPANRRHSLPRRQSFSSDVSEEGHSGPPPKAKRRNRDMSPPPPTIRRTAPPQAPMAPPAAGSVPHRTNSHRGELRPDERRRQDNIPSPRGGSLREKLGEKVASMLPNGLGPERPRYGSRNNSHNESLRSRRSREFQGSRLNRSHSDLDSNHDSDADTSEDEMRRRRRMREERDRERDQRYRERERDRGRPMRESDRDVDDDRDSGGRRDRGYLRRPDVQRRTSSHADIDRRDLPQWDVRDWDRIKKERRRVVPPEDRSPSPMGRRYPSDGAYERA
ncbi:hydroxyproline-rich glycoprotein DZ-HRGP [Sarocladium implicatum]|nr:hydroxyproline-rich glycoprotein DZ-HRGP [Sarocladium implicatum]